MIANVPKATRRFLQQRRARKILMNYAITDLCLCKNCQLCMCNLLVFSIMQNRIYPRLKLINFIRKTTFRMIVFITCWRIVCFLSVVNTLFAPNIPTPGTTIVPCNINKELFFYFKINIIPQFWKEHIETEKLNLTDVFQGIIMFLFSNDPIHLPSYRVGFD